VLLLVDLVVLFIFRGGCIPEVLGGLSLLGYGASILRAKCFRLVFRIARLSSPVVGRIVMTEPSASRSLHRCLNTREVGEPRRLSGVILLSPAVLVEKS